MILPRCRQSADVEYITNDSRFRLKQRLKCLIEIKLVVMHLVGVKYYPPPEMKIKFFNFLIQIVSIGHRTYYCKSYMYILENFAGASASWLDLG